MFKVNSKKGLALLMSLSVIFAMFPLSVFTASAVENTITINDYGALEKFATDVNNGNTYEGKTVKLADNFQTNSGVLKTPIGVCSFDANSKFNGKAFKGYFDGNGKTVKVDISQNDAYGVAVFSCTSGSAIIRDLSVSGKISGSNSVGGVVGCAVFGSTLKLINCSNFATVYGNGGVGGLVGIANADLNITNCSNSNTISGSYGAGGLVGNSNANLYTNNCYSSGSVSGKSYIGGLIGYSNSVGVYIQNGFYINTITNGVGNLSDDRSKAVSMSGADMKNSSKLLAKLNEYVGNNPTVAVNGKSVALRKWIIKGSENDGYPVLENSSKTASQNNAKATQKIRLTKKKYVTKKNAIKIKATANSKLIFQALKKSKYYRVSKNGKIKFTKKGTYKIKIKITAKANSKYKKTTSKKTITVNVK